MTAVAEGEATQLIPTPRLRATDAPEATTSSSPPTALSGILSVGSGANYSCALRNDGLVFCWGANNFGNLGNGSLAPSRVPVEASGAQRFTALAVGDANACGLTAAGEAWCWGDNFNGQLGRGTTGGLGAVPAPVTGGHTFTSLSIGLRSICGIATTGTTYCWGNNQNSQLGIGVTGGSINVPTAVVNSASFGFTSVSTGFIASCAVNAGGSVFCWGSAGPYFGNGATNPISNVPVPAASGRLVSKLDQGSLYACILLPMGRAACWGSQTTGELGTGSFTSPVFAPTPVSSTLRFASIDANHANIILGFTCALTPTGQAWCWGSNDFGQLGATGASTCTFGASTFNCSNVPLAVTTNRRFNQLGVGLRHVCALEGTGNVYCWGDNSFGQLGNNTLTPSMTPVKVVQLAAPAQNGYVSLNPLNATMVFLGGTQQFTALLHNEDGSPAAVQPTFQWRSSDPALATVDQNGLVTALMNGTVTITARTPAGQRASAPVVVNILDPNVAFQRAWSGSGSGTGVSDGLVSWGGMLADEWIHSGTFPTRLEVDRRAILTNNSQLTQLFASLQLARNALEFEAQRLLGVAPGDARIGQMRALAGYVYIGLAEAFCSGVPLDDPDTGLTTADLFTLAETRFGQALGGPIASPYDGLSRSGQARTRLGLNDLAGAAAAAALVPTSFSFATTHSATPGFENWVYSLNALQRRLTIADGEGMNGLQFRSANDPRVPWANGNGLGFDNITPWFIALKYTSVADPIVVASGTEARLIEAEVALRSGNVAAFLAGLNALRAPAGLPPVTDPGTSVGRADLLFSERAFWLYATGTRLGDMRRLINQYGRSEAAVLPTGAYPRFGMMYGTDANLPVPVGARGPSYAGCTDRTH